MRIYGWHVALDRMASLGETFGAIYMRVNCGARDPRCCTCKHPVALHRWGCMQTIRNEGGVTGVCGCQRMCKAYENAIVEIAPSATDSRRAQREGVAKLQQKGWTFKHWNGPRCPTHSGY